MTYANTHKRRSTATVLANNNWLALTGTALATMLSQYYNSTGKLVLTANVDSILVYYGHRMICKRGPASVSRS